MELSKDQKEALSDIMEWYKNYTSQAPILTFGGAAGTGKSTLIAELSKLLGSRNICYCAYTGKATNVLRNKLQEADFKDYNVSTIHSLMYNPVLNSDGTEIIGWERKNVIPCDFIVIDESSMVSKRILDDLMTYGVPILAVGDHYQLPPISSDNFNLMEDPMIKLDTPHRFTRDSEIIKIATLIRKGYEVKCGSFGKYVHKVRKRDLTEGQMARFVLTPDILNGEAICLCGYNKTRVAMNDKIRSYFKFKGLLNNNERVICLKNSNQANIPIYNGVCGTVKHNQFNTNSKYIKATIELDGIEEDYFRGYIRKDIFGNQKPDLHSQRVNHKSFCFDYGYCLTTHKSQGSQYSKVAVYEEYADNLYDRSRWLYTAVTRSSKELLLIS